MCVIYVCVPSGHLRLCSQSALPDNARERIVYVRQTRLFPEHLQIHLAVRGPLVRGEPPPRDVPVLRVLPAREHLRDVRVATVALDEMK